jgi:Holliday junction resolvase
MGAMSKRKGATGEREAAEMCREHGFEMRRGRQYCGGADSPDIRGEGNRLADEFHVEVKRVEALRIYPAIEQAKEDCAPGKDPVVLFRSNRQEWLAILPADVFFKLLKRLDLGERHGSEQCDDDPGDTLRGCLAEADSQPGAASVPVD